MNEYEKLNLWYCYTDWLTTKILIDGQWPGGRSYNNLIHFLNNKEFVVDHNVSRDKNRASDGIQLRREYFGEGYPTLPCTVLEMLIALAIRIDSEYTGDPGEPKPGVIFWEMVNNLDLTHTNNPGRILDRFMMREYEPSGRGGLFPLKHPTSDQRYVEIWYQMMSYVMENY